MKERKSFFIFLNKTFPSWKYLLIALLIVFSFAIYIHYLPVKNISETKIVTLDYDNSNNRIIGVSLPRDLNFSGEKVPQNDFSIRESLDREFITNKYWQSNALLLFKRANRWFPIIEPILKQYGVPDDFKYLAIAESNLTNAVSPMEAVGFWQIMKPTAKSLGLEVSEEVDERYHVQKSTEAACKYILKAYQRFKNWTLAAASYNMGVGGLELQLQKQQVSSYYDLMLNEETSRYIYRILAIKNIHKNPKHYGFEINKKDLYPFIPTLKVEIQESIEDLAVFAKSKGYTYKVLKIFNPWLRKTYLKNNEKKKYVLLFPEKKYLTHSFDDVENEVLKTKDSKDENTEIEKNISADSNQVVIHFVNKSESLKAIAKNYKVTIEEICMWNRINETTELKEGTELLIYTTAK